MTEGQARRELPETVVVGRVGKPHGVRGEVTVEVASDVDERWSRGSRLQARVPGLGRQTLIVAESRPRKEGLIVRFEGVEDRDQAEELRGIGLEVDRADVPPAPEGTYYFYELVDCECVDRRAGSLGHVVDVIEDGGGVLLEVRSDRGTLLIPFVLAYLESTDMERGRLELDLPEGLIETCTSTS